MLKCWKNISKFIDDWSDVFIKKLDIKTEKMTIKNADDAFGLWKSQFSRFCANSIIYEYWINNTDEIKDYINQKTANGEAIIAKDNEKTLGYFIYDIFDFHGAKSAFISFVGNASISENRYYIYTSLYRDIAEKWVSKGILNHYISICVDDVEIKNALFELGFGSYVVDAFSALSEIPSCENSVIISIATIADAEALYEIEKEAHEYYSLSPIFLKKEIDSFDEFTNFLKTNDILTAKNGEDIVGFMNVGISDNDDIYLMKGKGFGGMGAYIKKAYRGMNIGSQLIAAASEYYSSKSCSTIHVDWETANLYGNRFWQKYFTPTIISLKRTIHPDMIGKEVY